MSEESQFTTEEQPIVKISIYTPIIYVAVLLTTFIIFSIYYRKRKVQKLANMEPFFPENIQKDMYYELKDEDPKPNDRVLKAALIRMGSETLRRMIKLRESQQYVKVLYQKGSIGDDLNENYKIALKIQEVELQSAAVEAESYKQGWGATFFAVCQEVTFNEALRRRIQSIEDRKDWTNKQWLDTVESIEKKVIEAKK
ncbi:hypothetical protein BVG19_g657 [[Candida] boidinii]|nr:hypothetical protein BVG19_g657 [[Candida] boidinii]OWB51890.1 hypothetical protein B5S27_g3460 [[Candida] boidinii]OWB85695.1 hypothetical protein B5S33_g4366 [[Candida] boidinii]